MLRLLRGRSFLNVPGTKRKVASEQKERTSESRADMHEHVVIWVPLFDVFAFQRSRCTVQTWFDQTSLFAACEDALGWCGRVKTFPQIPKYLKHIPKCARARVTTGMRWESSRDTETNVCDPGTRPHHTGNGHLLTLGHIGHLGTSRETLGSPRGVGRVWCVR